MPLSHQRPNPSTQLQGSAWEVLWVFLRLGLTSFGGPAAHIGYFRNEFVVRRAWLSTPHFSELMALCQFLPGPSSSQLGMALGLARAGWRGMAAAWLGFTLPSALLLLGFAMGLTQVPSLSESGWVHGLKLAAVAIVAHAVWGMFRTLCPDRPRMGLALLATGLTLSLPLAWAQLAAIVATGVLGRLALGHLRATGDPAMPLAVSRRVGRWALAAFITLLLGLPVLSAWLGTPALALMDGVYRAGALVFGGGHVVLPLLEQAVQPLHVIRESDFVAGYGATQAVPGPLFTFAAYLGAMAHAPLTAFTSTAWPVPLSMLMGAGVLLICIFLPGALLLVAALPFWQQLRQRRGMHAALAGVNAGVVGVLFSTLLHPMWPSTVHTLPDGLVVLLALAALTRTRRSPVWVVALCAGAGAAMAALT